MSTELRQRAQVGPLVAITIRPARDTDLAAVSALLARTWHATYDAIYGAARVADITARWHAPENLARGLAANDGVFLVATDGERMLGTACAARTSGGAVKLDRLYVDPGVQGLGIGSRLLNACLEAFADSAAIELEVEPKNEQAIGFYRRHGFLEVGRTGDCSCSGDGIEALIMRRTARHDGAIRPAGRCCGD